MIFQSTRFTAGENPMILKRKIISIFVTVSSSVGDSDTTCPCIVLLLFASTCVHAPESPLSSPATSPYSFFRWKTRLRNKSSLILIIVKRFWFLVSAYNTLESAAHSNSMGAKYSWIIQHLHFTLEIDPKLVVYIIRRRSTHSVVAAHRRRRRPCRRRRCFFFFSPPPFSVSRRRLPLVLSTNKFYAQPFVS